MTSIWSALLGADLVVRHQLLAGWDTRLLEAGTGDVPLLLLPGTGGHLEAYARNVHALAADRRVVAYDYPGHGFSTLATHDLELEHYVAHLDALVDHLGVERVDVCGESLGGWVAVKYAVARPERVRRLVLNTPGGTMADPAVMERIRSLSQAAADDPTPERVRARLEWLMADPAAVTDELVAVRRAVYSRPGFARSMRHVLCLQDPEVRARNRITDDELRALVHPTLVVWTSDDPSGPAAAGLRMADLVP
ncbi:alpha/beta fold hydrolase [Nocardioides sp. TF02-7]|uniref:alpha/beta fold hydrolase n=1 Tax=Nocardioides sp. TF02-7 TaxID=2917724 RepID=UPI001F0506CD|nr:alpha/beta fold hydrolase [Nocardioides sp. TF02-7]UMG91300.1 alpha/beta fold hydrolase [Nocardioides sp. TF02-7]